jgi:transposase
MLYVGLDLHAKKIVMCVLDENGQVHSRRTVTQLDQMMNFLERLPQPWQVCFEASTGYGMYHEMLSKSAERVVVAHPSLLSIIYRSKRKNDRADAQKLAKLLYVGAVPSVHVPPSEVRAWRELVTFRRRLIEKRTQAKNGIRCLLRSLAIEPPRRPGLWSKAGMRWLESVPFTDRAHALKRDMLVAEIRTYNEQVRRVEQELNVYAANSAAVKLLQTIPGVGPRTAEAVAAFIDDPHRFPNAKRVGSYFGLTPCQDQSGNKNRLGHITREGAPVVRCLLTEATWRAIALSPTVKAYKERIEGDDKDRRKIAITATAHYLVRVMWAMLKTGRPWQESVAA